MIKKPFTRKTIAVFLFLFSLININGQGPTAPEAGSFESVDSPDMVNLLTGDLSYVLPLMEVLSPEGSYPITLNYHAGISMDQEASWVGLGWNINPGAINRSVSGVPDDWNNVLNSSISRDIGGEVRNTTIFAGLGFGNDDKNSIGLYASEQSNKAHGGETTYNYTFGVRGNIGRHNFGVGYSTQGYFSGNYSYSSRKYNSTFGVGFTSNGSDTYASISATSHSSLGISPIFDQTASISLLNGDNTNNSGSSSAVTKRTFDSFSINANFGFIKLGAETSGYEYWSFDERSYKSTGVLYAGKLKNTLENEKLPGFHSFDASESIHEFDTTLQSIQNNPTYVSYDSYNVSSQGLSGNITPYLNEFSSLHLSSSYHINKKNNLNGYGDRNEAIFQFYKYGVDGNYFTKSIDDRESEKTKFYFKNELSSFYQIEPTLNSGWTHKDNNNDGDAIESIHIPEGRHNSYGYSGTKRRLKQKNYIVTYTNKNLIGNTFYNKGIDRKSLDENGIGAFKITKADGITYHYALPVYQKEKFYRVTGYDKNINDKFSEEQSLSPYATHWLLTAITGPDYIDINNNNSLDEEDYGYWVDFDYGKWSDGFAWRVPKEGYIYGEDSKSYSWGLKEVYYLNSIKTRTHTAYFIKENRSDNKSISENPYGSNRNKTMNFEAHYFSFETNVPRYLGSDNKQYFPGIYSLQTPTELKNYWSTHSEIFIENKMFAKSYNNKSLRLKKIILLKNEDVPTNLIPNSGNQDNSSSLVSDLFFRERARIKANNGGGEYDSDWIDYVNSTYRGEYYNNIYDENDLPQNIEGKILKAIDFNYDYSTGINKNSQGKLTLKSISMKGHKGVGVLPSYIFDYALKNVKFDDNDKKDSWGYYKNIPSIWSLNKITTPVGADMIINYESDDYSKEAATNRIFFDKNMRIKFTKNISGEKFVTFSNSSNNDVRQSINFENYFKEGRKEYIDILYWQNDFIVDVAAECEVTYVSNGRVHLKLPNRYNKPDVRKNYNCNEKSWFFIKNFDGAVNKTLNWKEEINENSCNSKGERIKIRISSSYQKENTKGGGVRVKQIEVRDMKDNYITNYFYGDIPFITSESKQYKSSGSTSFSPSKFFKEIPYKSHIPSPVVMYKNVSVEKSDGVKSNYEFNVLDSFTIDSFTSEYSLGDFMKVKINTPIIDRIKRGPSDEWGGFNVGYDINKQNFDIITNYGTLGSLLSHEIFNKEEQLITATKNTYKHTKDINYGISKESFSSIERIALKKNPFLLNVGVTSVTDYPSVLESITEISNNNTVTKYFDKYDLLTGLVLETKTYNSNGKVFKTENIPAYTKYSGMGSKVDNGNNKNMLSQSAGEINYIFKNNEWKEIGASITTWDNNWLYPLNNTNMSSNDVWRKHKTFVWNGNLASDNTYDNFVEFNYTPTATNTNWRKISETTKYNQFSHPLEVKDINNNYAATRMGDNYSKVIATSNTAYEDMYYSGAEYIEGSHRYFEGNVLSATATGRNRNAHTGKYSVQINAGKKSFEVQVPARRERDTDLKRRFKLSVWVRNGDENRTKILVNNAQKPFNNAEKVYAGGWVQLNGYITIPTNGTSVAITSTSGTIYADDFRLHPISSSMTSYVYNEWDEVSYIMGANGLSSHYIYDTAGRLIETQVEAIDKVSGDETGGFKKVSKNSYNYKNNN